jgi:hypothetical protein
VALVRTDIEVGNDVDLIIDAYPGVVVTVAMPQTLRELFALRRIATIDGIDDEQDADVLDAALKSFADRFVKAWNLKLSGEKVPADGDGYLRLPMRLQFEILKAWLSAAQGGLEPPLEIDSLSTGGVSLNGALSPEPSEVTAAL